jgi:hypothetical protein
MKKRLRPKYALHYPVSQTIMMETFPPDEQAVAMSVSGWAQ